MLALRVNPLLLLPTFVLISLGKLRLPKLFQVLSKVLQIAKVMLAWLSEGWDINLQEKHVGVKLGSLLNQTDALNIAHDVLETLA